jgi:hypothetical protein
VEGATLDHLTDEALRSLERGDPPRPTVVAFLVRRYLTTGRDDVQDALGRALAEGISLSAAADTLEEQIEWLEVYIAAAGVSDDGRVRDAVSALRNQQRHCWSGEERVGTVLRSLDVCLRDSAPLSGAADASLIVEAVDALERIVGRAYEPGAGLAAAGFRDHIACGSALLTAFHATGRLPYAMLAEELFQFARRTWGDEEASLFREERGADPFTPNCEAVAFLGALSRLHDDDTYRKAAVLAPGAEYREDARRLISALSVRAPEQPLASAARFGSVLSDWLTHEGSGLRAEGSGGLSHKP